IGSSETRLVKGLTCAAPLSTKLPSVISARPTRPVIGAVTRVNSRLSSAPRSAASVEAMRIDLKQEVALPNNRAFLEMHALQVAGNAWANLDRVDCFKSPGELVAVAQLLADYFRHTYFHWGWSFGLS